MTNEQKIEELKKELASFLKQKDEVFADFMRLDGIVAYINNQIKVLETPSTPQTDQKKEKK